MIVNKLKMLLETREMVEQTAIKEQMHSMKQQADIDYIAMMTDVDIPTDEEGCNVRED